MNKSAVPLGAGVSIATGLKPNLGFLLDCNQATYNITSGSDWHLLYIQADRPISSEGMLPDWTFALKSAKVADVAKLYTIGETGEAIPRLVDTSGQQVLPAIVQPPNEVPQAYPAILLQIRETSDKLETDQFAYTVSSPEQVMPQWTKLQLDYYKQHRQLTIAGEAGTHIFQIAYHRIVSGTPPTAEIIQVARSDFHFWPVPVIPVWSRFDDLNSIQFDNCGA